MKIPELEALARDMVGDDQKPDVFFVSSFEGGKKSRGVILITTEFEIAYKLWSALSCRNHESALENRTFGVIACVEPAEEGSKKLVVLDDSGSFLRYKHQRLYGPRNYKVQVPSKVRPVAGSSRQGNQAPTAGRARK